MHAFIQSKNSKTFIIIFSPSRSPITIPINPRGQMALPSHLCLLHILHRDTMSIAHNPVLSPATRAIASTRALPRNHLAVLRDAVAVLRVDIALRLLRLVLRRRPRQVVSADLDVIVRE